MASPKREKFTKWDVVDHLKTEADMARYLQACLDEAPDDAAFLAQAIGDIARARGLAQLSKETGITRQGLHKALARNGNPSLGTTLKVLTALGVKIVVKPKVRSTRPARGAHVTVSPRRGVFIKAL